MPQKGSLKNTPMEHLRLADILHLGKSAMLCLISQLATSRRRSNSFQAAAANKSSLKTIPTFSGCPGHFIHLTTA